MKQRSIHVQIIIAAIVSGLILNFFFKWIETKNAIKVYTLLLNVDYFPILRHYTFSEWIEVFFHLLVSVALSFILYWLAIRLHQTSRGKMVKLISSVSVIIGLLIYPTTVLSSRTPDVTDITSFSLWLLGHLIFGLFLALLLPAFQEEKSI